MIGGTDSDGDAAEPLQVEPAPAHEGDRVPARLGVHVAEDLQDQLVGKYAVDPIMVMTSHRTKTNTERERE